MWGWREGERPQICVGNRERESQSRGNWVWPQLRSHDCRVRRSGSGTLTVGWRVCTFPFLDGDVVNGDVSLDAGPSDPFYQHLRSQQLGEAIGQWGHAEGAPPTPSPASSVECTCVPGRLCLAGWWPWPAASGLLGYRSDSRQTCLSLLDPFVSEIHLELLHTHSTFTGQWCIETV